MQVGYVLCTPDRTKILCVQKESNKVDLKEIDTENSLNKALCLHDLTSIKDIYERFKEMKLVDELDIVNVAELQNHLNL